MIGYAFFANTLLSAAQGYGKDLGGFNATSIEKAAPVDIGKVFIADTLDLKRR